MLKQGQALWINLENIMLRKDASHKIPYNILFCSDGNPD